MSARKKSSSRGSSRPKSGKQSGALSNGKPATLIVLFGGAGDLVKMKLGKAIARLFTGGKVCSNCRLLAVDREPFDDESFRRFFIRDCRLPADLAELVEAELGRIHYQQMDLCSPEDYQKLRARIEDLRSDAINHEMYYYSVWSELYPTIAHNLKEIGIIGNGGELKQTHYLEKPVGSDFASSKKLLDSMLSGKGIDQKRLFLMDHYLGKEAVRNMLVFLWGNRTRSPVLNAEHVSRVIIYAYESIGVDVRRAKAYDRVGTLKDMWVPHLLQLLALFSCEDPGGFENLPTKKRELLEAVRKVDVSEVPEYAVFGQYDTGLSDGKQVCSYREEPGVSHDSITETFAAIRLFIDNERWKDVPFDVITGKRMSRKETGVRIFFREAESNLFTGMGEVIDLRIQPDPAIRHQFLVKAPGDWDRTSTATSNYNYQQRFEGVPLVDYETLLLEAMSGTGHLFVRSKSIRECWKIGEPFIEYLRNAQPQDIFSYSAGSDGPVQVVTSKFGPYSGIFGVLD